jgi:hypothetical protein
MAHYLISFDWHAMDDIPEADMPAVADAAHAVVQEAITAGVYVFAGGIADQRASLVATDRTVTEGPYPDAIGGMTIINVPSLAEALVWAGKIAVACRCTQEVRQVGPDPERDRMHHEAGDNEN